MLDRRALLMAVVLCCGLTATRVPAGDTDAYRQALWRLEYEFVSWAELEEVDARMGVPVARRGQTLERFLSRLEFWESEIGTLDTGTAAELQRKIAAIRSRIESWPGPDVAVRGSRGSGRFPFGWDPVEPRPVVPTAVCTQARPVSAETVSWSTTDYSQSESSRMVAWFDASDLPSGWYRLQTVGSDADTALTVFDGCGGAVLGANDDSLGLQSRLAVLKKDTSELIVRVEIESPEGQQLLLLSLDGVGAGSVTGTVRDDATGQSIESVSVRLYDASGSYAGGDWTGADGVFRFDGLDPGTYFLKTENTDNYVDEIWDGIPCEESCEATDGDPIEVTFFVVQGIDFELSAGASIGGVIVDRAGHLVKTGDIELFDQTGFRLERTYLDSLGRYEFRGLMGGTYFLATDLRGYQDELWDNIPCDGYCDPMLGNQIVLLPLEKASGFDFVVEALGTISGRLTDSQSGLPVVGGPVVLERSDGGDSDWEYSDVHGNWVSDGLLPGTYFVGTSFYGVYQNQVYDGIPCDPDCRWDEGTPIALSNQEEITGIDIALERLGGISGSVLAASSGTPLADLWVEAWNSFGQLVDSGYSSTLGRYELADLLPGTYFVLTDEDGAFIDQLFDEIPCFGGPPSGCDPVLGTPIPIALGEVRFGVDFRLSLGGTLRGAVRDAATGEPVADSRLRIFGSGGQLLRIVEVDSRAQYLTAGLPADDYFLQTDSDSHLDQLWKGFECEGGCNPLTGTPIPLDLGALVENLDFALVLQGGISGFVTDGAGDPVAGVHMHAWNSAGEAVAGDLTDARGLYQIELSSGFYTLSTHVPDGYLNQLWKSKSCPLGAAIHGLCDPLTGDRITVVGAEPVQVGFDFRLDEEIFLDDFESGSFSAWSGVSE